MGNVKRAKLTAPKVWIRRNRRLCRNYSIEYYPERQNIISNSCKELRSPILDLPDECLVTVFKNLTAYELCSVSRVCKRFYHVSCNSALWSSIDLSFEDLLSSYTVENVSFIDLDNNDHDSREERKNSNRRMSFAKFLSERNAALTEIRARGDFNICHEANMFIYLLNNCSVRNLKKIDFSFPRGYWDQEFNQAFQRVLRCILRNCSRSLKILRCDADVSCTTAKLIGSLQNLEHLSLHFPSQRQILQPEALNIILSSLPKLKHFKITIRPQFYDDLFPGYIIKSDSLESLDFGCTKMFLVTEMILPRLHTILNAEFLHMGVPLERELCLFNITERGCPLIQSINGYTSVLPGLQNFQLSDIKKRDLNYCKCVAHFLYRGLH